MDLRRILAACVIPAMFLTGCGSDDTVEDPVSTASESPAPETEAPDETTETPEGEALPDCAEIWVDGETLPEEYDGCLEAGEPVQAESRYCEAGAPLFTHGDRFYAAAGARVNEVDGPLAESDDYQTALEACGG